MAPISAISIFAYIFYGNMLLIGLMAAWDWYRNRIVKSFVIGAAGLLAAEYLAALLMIWPAWKGFTTGLVQAWAQHFT
jgi:hypothetical protein